MIPSASSIVGFDQRFWRTSSANSKSARVLKGAHGLSSVEVEGVGDGGSFGLRRSIISSGRPLCR